MMYTVPLKGVLKKACVLLVVLICGTLVLACPQDSIFYGISYEVKPLDPRIKGTPTNIVTDGDKLYVASKFNKTIYQYGILPSGSLGWSTVEPAPGGEIMELAATQDYLYALTGEPGTMSLRRKHTKGADLNWETISPDGVYKNLQTIYGAGTRLFASAMISTTEFAILYEEDTSNELHVLKSDAKCLNSAVYDETNYYLATAGDGIITFSNPSTPITNTEGLNILGLIRISDTIVAVSSNGQLLYGDSSGFTVSSPGYNFTGALALTKVDEEVHVLLLGIHGSASSTTHGYREIVLTDGTLNPGNLGLNTPGKDPDHSSVSNYDTYNSTLGKHPVTSILQAPDTLDTTMTLFAATTKNGLWSYRQRNREWQWNAEE
ncbi:MAG: hypothetical protein LBT13_10990 [Treponema sp.]|nr:hypothetical protein [Treponema sp.]